MPQLERRPFWFLRHGETDWNTRHLAQGCTDIPLNATGLAQAAQAGQAFAARFAQGQRLFTHIVSSPLGRAHETARYVHRALVSAPVKLPLEGELPLSCEPDLREVSFGVKEGDPMGDWYEMWLSGTATPEKGESFPELRARAVEGVNRAFDLAGEDGVPLIVAHGALFRALRNAMGLTTNVRLPNAVPVFAYPQDERWIIEGL